MSRAAVANRALRIRKAVVRLVSSYTLFTDVSEFQRSPYSNAYPYQFASFRANDGTYVDHKAAANLAWCKAAADAGRIAGFIVYVVYRPNWQETLATLKLVVGTPHPKMAVMIDVESWGGQITGNQSVSINAMREAIISWLGANRKRCTGYANAGDFAALWPTRGDTKVILANYSSNPAFPNKIAHQYTSSANVAPFGSPVDLNSADGLTPAQFAASLGLVTPVPPKPTPTPVPIMEADDMLVRFPNDKSTPSSAGAIYLVQGGCLVWTSIDDYRPIEAAYKLPVAEIVNHKTSRLYLLPIAPGTPDPRKATA